MPITRLLITDLDNTLYNWVDYFGPAFRAVVHALSRRLSIAEDDLTAQFRDIYARFETTEYPFTVQRLPAIRTLPQDEQDRLVTVALTVFGASRRKRLRPYIGVQETFRWACQEGLSVTVVTGAPSHVVAPKLNQLGLLSHTSHIVAWEGFDLPDDLHLGDRFRESPVRTRVTTTRLPRHCLLEKQAAYQVAIDEANISPNEAVVVGDSLFSDILPALNMGLRTYWAAYGLAFSPKNRTTVEQITPGGVEAVRRAYATEPVPGGAQPLAGFADLQRLLTTPQPALF